MNSHDIGWDHLVQLEKRRWQKTEPWGVSTLRSREEEEPAKDWEGPSSELEEKSGDWCAGSQVKKAFQKGVFNGVVCCRQTLFSCFKISVIASAMGNLI